MHTNVPVGPQITGSAQREELMYIFVGRSRLFFHGMKLVVQFLAKAHQELNLIQSIKMIE